MALTRLPEPLVLVGGVVYDQIEDEFHSPIVYFLEEFFEVLHRTEICHDGSVIGDVVAVVGIGRVKHRTQPNDINTQVVQVVEFADDAVEVTDAVAVGVFKATWINLVDDGFFPP